MNEPINSREEALVSVVETYVKDHRYFEATGTISPELYQKYKDVWVKKFEQALNWGV